MAQGPPVLDAEELALLNEFLEGRFGLVFPDHKKEILESRLRPRLVHLGVRSFREYYLRLQFHPNGGEELRALAQAVTNNETYFFRETHQFDALFEEAVEALKADASHPGELRFCCAGCSSGEEPYTLNIYLKENQYRLWGVQSTVDAFDLDASRVETAKAAEYGPGSFRGLDPEKVHRYFTEGVVPGVRTLKAPFRSGVRFRVGNVLSPEAYAQGSPYDALFCRNVIIYFSETSLHQVVARFAAALRPGGLLFLGHSESLIGVTRLFEPIRLGTGIVYRRVGGVP